MYFLDYSDRNTKHLIYLDNNIFRLLKCKPQFWNNFFEFFERHDPDLFMNFEFIFTWLQLLEDINLGKIITQIKSHELWIKNIRSFQDHDLMAINKSLDKLYDALCKIITSMPELQQNKLLDQIDISIGFAHSPHSRFIKSTLLKARNFIETDIDLDDLKHELAWTILISHIFITLDSKKQWQKRKYYFDSLIALWHKLFIDKRQLNFYPLLEKRYRTYLEHQKLSSNYNEDFWLKSQSDLCDGEIIHFATLGCNTEMDSKNPIICITSDSPEKILNRIAISKQSFIDLQNVENWKIKPVPGKILCLNINKTKITKEIINASLINLDTPFEKTMYTSTTII